jgi:hypothetical protein
MTHVETHYRVIVAAGHHRQPRSTATWIEPNPPSTSDQVPGTPYTPYAQDHLAYTDGGGNPALARFVFWSVTDGTNGLTVQDQQLHQPVTAGAMTVTAWYVPEGGGGHPGPSFEFVDAFSDAIGDFVNDTFVTVTSDPSLTNDANVIGEVPTTVAETLLAAASISTGERFEHWVGGTPTDDVDAIAAGSSGIAIATYRRPDPLHIPKLGDNYAEAVYILYGIINDAPGAVWVPGRGPHPVDPGWGSYLQRVGRAATVGSLGAKMRGGAEITKIALAEVEAAAKELVTRLDKEVVGKQINR